jgi:hypothetical protein
LHSTHKHSQTTPRPSCIACAPLRSRFSAPLDEQEHLESFVLRATWPPPVPYIHCALHLGTVFIHNGRRAQPGWSLGSRLHRRQATAARFLGPSSMSGRSWVCTLPLMALGMPWDSSTALCLQAEPVQTASWPPSRQPLCFHAASSAAGHGWHCNVPPLSAPGWPLLPSTGPHWHPAQQLAAHPILTVPAFRLSAAACAVFGSITEDPNLQIAAAAGEALRQLLCWHRQLAVLVDRLSCATNAVTACLPFAACPACCSPVHGCVVPAAAQGLSAAVTQAQPGLQAPQGS